MEKNVEFLEKNVDIQELAFNGKQIQIVNGKNSKVINKENVVIQEQDAQIIKIVEDLKNHANILDLMLQVHQNIFVQQKKKEMVLEKHVVHSKDIVMENIAKISTKNVKLENILNIEAHQNAFLKK